MGHREKLAHHVFGQLKGQLLASLTSKKNYRESQNRLCLFCTTSFLFVIATPAIGI